MKEWHFTNKERKRPRKKGVAPKSKIGCQKLKKKGLTQKTKPDKQNWKLSISMAENICFKSAPWVTSFTGQSSNISILIVPIDTMNTFNLPITLIFLHLFYRLQ